MFKSKAILILLFLSSCVAAKKQTSHHVLDGSKSYDIDGTIVQWMWKQLSGEKAIIQSPNSVRTNITFIDSATILLTVVDNDGALGRDTIKIKK